MSPLRVIDPIDSSFSFGLIPRRRQTGGISYFHASLSFLARIAYSSSADPMTCTPFCRMSVCSALSALCCSLFPYRCPPTPGLSSHKLLHQSSSPPPPFQSHFFNTRLSLLFCLKSFLLSASFPFLSFPSLSVLKLEQGPQNNPPPLHRQSVQWLNRSSPPKERKALHTNPLLQCYDNLLRTNGPFFLDDLTFCKAPSFLSHTGAPL